MLRPLPSILRQNKVSLPHCAFWPLNTTYITLVNTMIFLQCEQTNGLLTSLVATHKSQTFIQSVGTPLVCINEVCCMTVARRTAEQGESLQLTNNLKFFTACSISSPLEHCGTSEVSVSQSCDKAADEHRALVPLLCYLLYSHTRGTTKRAAVHDVTHIPIFTCSKESKRWRGWSSRAIGGLKTRERGDIYSYMFLSVQCIATD